MKKKWLATAVSKKYLLIFLVAFLALVLVFAYGKKSSPPQVECVVNADVVCGAPRNITGMVYSQCEYSGEVAIKTDLGIDWSVASGPWSCVAAGRAGGRLYAVFEKSLVSTSSKPTTAPSKTFTPATARGLTSRVP